MSNNRIRLLLTKGKLWCNIMSRVTKEKRRNMRKILIIFSAYILIYYFIRKIIVKIITKILLNKIK